MKSYEISPIEKNIVIGLEKAISEEIQNYHPEKELFEDKKQYNQETNDHIQSLQDKRATPEALGALYDLIDDYPFEITDITARHSSIMLERDYLQEDYFMEVLKEKKDHIKEEAMRALFLGGPLAFGVYYSRSDILNLEISSTLLKVGLSYCVLWPSMAVSGCFLESLPDITDIFLLGGAVIPRKTADKMCQDHWTKKVKSHAKKYLQKKLDPFWSNMRI